MARMARLAKVSRLLVRRNAQFIHEEDENGLNLIMTSLAVVLSPL
jgi:hypothetical protein